MQDKPGKHLPYESPKLQAVREYVVWTVETGKVHPRLVMNFDQAPPIYFRCLGSFSFFKLPRRYETLGVS